MEPVEKLVPHSGKMSLLSRVKEIDTIAHTLCAEVDINANSFFYDNSMNGVPVWIGFEYMAQSIAALSGKWDLERGEQPKMGFILGVKHFNAKIHSFSEGTTISIFVKESLRLDPVVSFECNIALNETILATATLNTIKVDNIEDFIKP
jgi:predicted hotdog family 3-hydroxylacyl-ACP dehydratase